MMKENDNKEDILDLLENDKSREERLKRFREMEAMTWPDVLRFIIGKDLPADDRGKLSE